MFQHGFYDFLNWFDERAWYPLGRIVGGTVYPGQEISHRLGIQMCSPIVTPFGPGQSVTVGKHIYYKKGHLGPHDFVTMGRMSL